MLVNWPPVVRGLVAIVPPMLALMVAFARYDGFFEDRLVFLYFMAGLVLGLVAAFFETYLVFAGEGRLGLLYLALTPTLAQLGKTVGVNLPRFQGERTSVFHGGAMGAGVGAMVVLAYAEVVVHDPLWRTGGLLLVLGVGVSLAHLATGAYIGEHVARGRPFRGMAIATVATLPVAWATFEFLVGRHPLWTAVALLWGAGLFWYARREVLPQGLSHEQRKEMRRRIRRARS